MDRLKNVAYGGLGFLVLLGVYLAYGWVSQRYTEFIVMRVVMVAVACQHPTEAAKLGIACGPPPQSGPGAVAPGNATPAAPAAPR